MAALELYLIRHGVAADCAAGQSDESRALTADGIARLREEAAGLQALKVRWDLILTSPLLRARQTAEVLAESMKSDAPVIVTNALAPSGTHADILAELARYRPRSGIALVGHEPGVGQLATRLLGAREPMDFKKGAVCRLDFNVPPPEGIGTLRWFATPKLLRLSGQTERKH